VVVARERVAVGTPATGSPAAGSQTLDRGLRVLAVVAGAEAPMSTADVAVALDLHRSIAYRMLRTLEGHGLLRRHDDGRFGPGLTLAVLARRVAPTLQGAATAELSSLADAVGMTAFLVVRDGDDAVTIAVVEPRHVTAHVAYRPGNRHPVDRGAPGIALLAGADGQRGERAAVTSARRRGWAHSRSEVLPGMRSVASPVVDALGTLHGALCVVFVGVTGPVEDLGVRVCVAARTVADRLS
jgi:DNA-binding IclR family transcriptional regulator